MNSVVRDFDKNDFTHKISIRQTLTVFKDKVMLCQQISMKLSKRSSKTAVILFIY